MQSIRKINLKYSQIQLKEDYFLKLLLHFYNLSIYKLVA